MENEGVHPVYVLLVLVYVGHAFYWGFTTLGKTRGDKRMRTVFKRMGVLAGIWLLIVVPCMLTAILFDLLGLH